MKLLALKKKEGFQVKRRIYERKEGMEWFWIIMKRMMLDAPGYGIDVCRYVS